MPNYQNGKIYKIYSYENDDVYYGSTCEELSQRMARHRSCLKSYKKDYKHYMTSFKILEFESAKIELVENYSCNSKEELLQREGYYIKTYDCVNKNIAGRTKKECNKDWYENNKEQILEKRKEYNAEHKIQKKEYDKNYHQQKNKDKYNEGRRQKRKFKNHFDKVMKELVDCFGY